MFLTFFVAGCSSLTSQETYPSVAEECELSGSENSPQCKIANSAELTLAEQANVMGHIYYFASNGVKKDCNKAQYWLKKAAAQGDEEALDNLGMMYFSGCGVGIDQNYKRAAEYHLLANEEGSIHAKANLGSLYLEGGPGLPQDYDKALYWYQLATNDNPVRAYDGLASLYIEQENYEEAYKYVVKAADLGHPQAEYNLGYFYENGLVVEQDKEKAKYWYEKAAAQGWANAQNNLDILLKKMEGKND